MPTLCCCEWNELPPPPPVPEELKDIHPLEARLLAPRIPFMKLHAASTIKVKLKRHHETACCKYHQSKIETPSKIDSVSILLWWYLQHAVSWMGYEELKKYYQPSVQPIHRGQWSSFGGTSVKAVHALLCENSCLHWQSGTSCPAWIRPNH